MRGLFSIYNPPINTAKRPYRNVSLQEVVSTIVGGTLKAKTDTLRGYLSSGDGDRYKEEKSLILPTATFGGVFEYRQKEGKEKIRDRVSHKVTEVIQHALPDPSGYIIIDIDHLSELGLSLDQLRENLSQDLESGVRMIFKSPSGDGLKMVCETSTEIANHADYTRVYQSLRHYINNRHGQGKEIVDKCGSDIARTCLLCHDPECRIYDNPHFFKAELHPVPQDYRPLREVLNLPEFEDDGIEEIVRRVEESRINLAPDYGTYLRLAYSFGSLGEDRGGDYFHRVCAIDPSYNEEHADWQFNECLYGEGNIGYFVNLAKSRGVDVSRKKDKKIEQAKMNNTIKGTPEVQNTQTEETPIVSPFDKFFQIDDLTALATNKREGFKTNYRFFGDRGKEEYLSLRSGALTMVCGKSSHCKSKFLQNLALQVTKETIDKQEEGVVLFFTYEEEKSDVLFQFANIYSNIPNLSMYGTENVDVIQDYFRDKNLSRCVESKRERIAKSLEEFNEKIYKSGRLRVHYPDLYADNLCELIEYFTTKMKVRAVFVDYVQLLYIKGRKDRREEIKDICDILNKTAIRLGLPIVLSAQLNRQTPNPTEMSEDNIADSADLTRYANTIVCLWNSKFNNVAGKREDYLGSEDYKKIERRGFILGESGKVYAKITKNRGATPYIDSILHFTGETGVIAENSDLPQGGEVRYSKGIEEE